jgi:outer membrane protein
MKQASFLVLILAGAMCNIADAQTAPPPKTHELTAQQAVDLALKQRIEILNAQLDIKHQEAFNSEVTGTALPQVKGNISGTHFFNIPVTVLPDFISPSVYGVLNKEGVKDGNGNVIQVPTNINTFPAQFGTPWQASVGFNIQQLLFQPDVFVGLKARSTALELYENQLKIAEDSVKSNVYRAYYGVLIAQKGLEFAKESESRLSKLLNDQGELFKNGFIERLDLDKTQVNLNNIHTTVLQLQNLVEMGYSALKLAVAVPQQDKIVLTDSLSNDQIRKDIFSLEEDFKYQNRSEIQTLETTSKLLDYQIKRQKLNALPTVAANYNLGTSAQRNRFNFFDTKDRWFVSHYAGLGINVPIFDGNQRRSKLKQAEIDLSKNKNTIIQLRQVIDFQVVAARTQLTNAISALNVQEENKLLAEKVYATTKTKYERGLGSSFEVIQSETSLQDALNNYFQAIYNAIIAKIAYIKALGKL